MSWLIWLLLGLAGLAGTVTAMVVVGGRALSGALAHDPNVCDCWECKHRRTVAFDKAIDRRHRNNRRRPSGIVRTTDPWWATTNELRVGDRVSAAEKAAVYKVVELQGQSFGVLVWLVDTASGRRSMITIKTALLDSKIWQRVP
ncbi:MAG: hypothetical protein ABWY81_10900 [Jiangellaceae bacterium]